jgi:hypothetical protein
MGWEFANACPIIPWLNAAPRPNMVLALRKRRRELLLSCSLTAFSFE